EVILNFLEDLLRSTGVFVPRRMVPPAPNTDLYKPRKRKRNQEEEELKKRESKKQAGTTSKVVEEKVVDEKIVEEKGDQKVEAVVAEKAQKKNLKRKSSGIKIDEGRSKLIHDKRSKEDRSSTESDDVPLAQKLKQKTSKAYAKEMHKKFST
ncbi:hypothetical protein A2U01_0052049, partial [Trifolium medium]|nr:hypothetical protein [Trifolium medium]